VKASSNSVLSSIVEDRPWRERLHLNHAATHPRGAKRDEDHPKSLQVGESLGLEVLVFNELLDFGHQLLHVDFRRGLRSRREYGELCAGVRI
jgi:hypothetical protein